MSIVNAPAIGSGDMSCIRQDPHHCTATDRCLLSNRKEAMLGETCLPRNQSHFSSGTPRSTK